MSAIQQLRDSGLFEEDLSKRSGNERFEVRGWPKASIWAGDNEIHIRKGAFENRRFRNINDELHEYVRRHKYGFYRERSDPAYKVRTEHVPGLIRIIASGRGV